MTQTSPPGTANRILDALPPRLYRKLSPALEAIDLTCGQVLHEAGEVIRHVYFPCGGLVALLTPLSGTRAAEVAVVGREGFVGLSVLLGADISPHRAVVQSPGRALRIEAARLRTAADRSRGLSAHLLRYADAFLVQVSQSAVCNGFHTVQKRYCRWLLLAHDRVEADDLPFTHKSLALMLAVRLASVSEVAGALQRAGLIDYRRGEVRIRVTDRQGLEGSCCDCYRVIKNRFDLLFEAWDPAAAEP